MHDFLVVHRLANEPRRLTHPPEASDRRPIAKDLLLQRCQRGIAQRHLPLARAPHHHVGKSLYPSDAVSLAFDGEADLVPLEIQRSLHRSAHSMSAQRRCSTVAKERTHSSCTLSVPMSRSTQPCLPGSARTRA